MVRNAAGRQIEEYYPKKIFTRRYPGLAEAAAGLNAGCERLCEILAALSADELQRPEAPGRWSPAEVADHLVLVNQLFVRVLDAACDPRASLYLMAKGHLSEEGKAISTAEGEPRPERGREELLADVRNSTAALIESARQNREVGKLDQPCLLHAFFGEMSACECVQMAAWHMTRHVRKLSGSI